MGPREYLALSLSRVEGTGRNKDAGLADGIENGTYFLVSKS